MLWKIGLMNVVNLIVVKDRIEKRFEGAEYRVGDLETRKVDSELSCCDLMSVKIKDTGSEM